MASMATFVPSALVLIGTAIAICLPDARTSITDNSPHGFTEVLYAFTSAANNNGSAFAGLQSNTDFYNIALGITMLLGRFVVIYAVLAIAGTLAQKNALPTEHGMFKTYSPLFICMLASIVCLFGLLTFLPSLALGPVADHMAMVVPQAVIAP